MSDITIKKGNLVPVISATLLNADGSPIDLTGATVHFNMDGPSGGFSALATIVSPTAGTVTYTFSAGQTNVAGDYIAEWLITFSGGSVRRMPETGYLTLQILETLPIAVPTNITRISDTYEMIRAITGDFDAEFRRYEDSAIASVVRTVLKIGKLEGYSVSSSGQAIMPIITDPRIFAVLAYNAAHMLAIPNAAAYSYRRRGASESFGEQRHFIFHLQNALAAAEGDSVFVSFTTLYSWVNSIAGIDVWAQLSEARVQSPISTLYVDSSGVHFTGDPLP